MTNSVENISIGILVTKSDYYANQKKSNGEKQNGTERNINFIDVEEHKKFVDTIFSVFEPVKKESVSNK